LNPIRSIRIYPHGNPCSLENKIKEKQDKLAKRDHWTIIISWKKNINFQM
jgi:hypothetical protein